MDKSGVEPQAVEGGAVCTDTYAAGGRVGIARLHDVRGKEKVVSRGVCARVCVMLHLVHFLLALLV